MQSPENTTQVSREVIEKLRENAQNKDFISLNAFVKTALYDADLGYYRKNRTRIGRSEETDFYTNSSLDPLFGDLLMEAIRNMLQPDPPESFQLVEIGAENNRGMLTSHANAFAGIANIGIGEDLIIPERSVVISNELFDAQPFLRFQRCQDAWYEVGLHLHESSLTWGLFPEPADRGLALPNHAQEGYIIDLPTGAEALLKEIGKMPWQGLFIAIDYGLDSTTIFQNRAQGTARTYSQHRQGTNILENPGSVDITHHIIWDRMEAILRGFQFNQIQTRRQESFFMNESPNVISNVLEETSSQFSSRRQTLKELLHPENMGAKFQILSARRNS